MNPSPAGEPRDRLCAFLERTRNADGGWPYYAGRQSRIEPTAWAMLALALPEGSTPLGTWRGADGLLVEPAIGVVNFGFNGLAALALAAPSTGGANTAAAITQALLAHKGVQVPAHPAVQQDPKLQAWSWMDGTFSWVEPTAWCMLAVKKSGLARSATARARASRRRNGSWRIVLGDGGWNYGNGVVYRYRTAGARADDRHRNARAAGPQGPAHGAGGARVPRVHVLKEGSSGALALGWLALRALAADGAAVAAALDSHVAVAEEFGNVANAAMLLCARLSRLGHATACIHAVTPMSRRLDLTRREFLGTAVGAASAAW